MAGRLKISLSPGEMKAMLSAFQFAYENFPAIEQWDMLLKYHLEQLRNSIAKRIIDKKEKSLTLDPIEALAFWLLWMQIDISKFAPYEQQVMQQTIDEVDQYVQSLKAVQNGQNLINEGQAAIDQPDQRTERA